MSDRQLILIPARLGPDGWPSALLTVDSRLRLDPDAAVFKALGYEGADPRLRVFPPRPLPLNATVQCDTPQGPSRLDRDPYGAPLTWLPAAEAATAIRAAVQLHLAVPLSPWNEAVLGFCDALPPDSPVVLMWE